MCHVTQTPPQTQPGAAVLLDELDHPPLFDDEVWWDCKICGKWRPDDKISVRKRLSWFQYPDPYDAQRMGTLYERVRHCNDKPNCRRIRPLRHGDGVTAADLRTADIFGGLPTGTARRFWTCRPSVRTVVG